MAEHKAEPGEKKSSKKLIIIIVAVLLLLGGAGGYYCFFMRGADHAAEGDAAEPAKADGAEGDEKHAAKKAEHGSDEDSADPNAKKSAEEEAMYFDLAHPMIVNFPKGTGATLVQVSLSFLADSEETTVELKKHEPMLRNNLMMKISAQSPESLKTKEGKEALRVILLDEVNQVLSKMAAGKHVKEVFFTSLVMQ